jgi:hypothetical protein
VNNEQKEKEFHLESEAEGQAAGRTGSLHGKEKGSLSQQITLAILATCATVSTVAVSCQGCAGTTASGNVNAEVCYATPQGEVCISYKAPDNATNAKSIRLLKPSAP